MNETEKQVYTRREAGKELAALEAHLRGLTEETQALCNECAGKHLLHLSELADEGKTFFPSDREFWERLGKWVTGVLDVAEKSSVTPQLATKWAGEARDLRRELQEKYMNGLGACNCVTGLEPCCPRKAVA